MRKWIIAVLAMVFVLMLAGTALAVTLPLKGLWDRNPETDLGGYNLYRTDGARVKINSTLIPTTMGTTTSPYLFSLTVPDGSEGTLRFRLTAVDALGNESLDSNEAPYSYDYKAPVAPTGFGVTKQLP